MIGLLRKLPAFRSAICERVGSGRMAGAPRHDSLLLVGWLPVLHGAAALALAGVLAGALVVTGFAAAFTFAGILAGAVMRGALLLLGQLPGVDAEIGCFELWRTVVSGRGLGGKAAGDNSRQRSASEQGL